MTSAVHVQVLGRTIACQISSACHACMFVCECDMGSAGAGVWQDHSMPDIVCLSCMHLCECDMGSVSAGVGRTIACQISLHACLCVSVTWAVQVQVFGRTTACQMLSACHACICVSVTWAVHAQVFGRTMVCKDVDVANKVAHRDNLDGVTMAGTQVSKKGVFKGGFHDLSRCVLCSVSC